MAIILAITVIIPVDKFIERKTNNRGGFILVARYLAAIALGLLIAFLVITVFGKGE